MNESPLEPAGGFGGAVAPAFGYVGPPYGRPSKRLAIISLVLGVLAIPTVGIGIGLAFAVAAMITASRAKVQIAQDPTRYTGRGFAIAGSWTGCAALLLLLAYVMMFVLAVLLLRVT